MLFKKLSVIACSSLISCMVFAQNNTDESITNEIIDSFLQCDNQFFHQLAKNQAFFNQYAELTTFENIAYIPVENLQKYDQDHVMFKTPINYNGLTITGYKNLFINTPFSGRYYFWGFILDNSLDEAKASLDKIDWLKYSPTAYIANSKIYDNNDKSHIWQDNPYSIDQVIPREDTIEKSIYLEITSENKLNLLCSLQGDITKDILYPIRPDIKPFDEEIKAKRLEIIKDYKLKKQKDDELLEKQQSQSDSNNTNLSENNSKDGI